MPDKQYKGTVLVVDDDAGISEYLVEYLNLKSYAVVVCRGGHAALEHLSRGLQYDVAIVDLEMRDITGEELIKNLSQSRPGKPVVIYSAWPKLLPGATHVVDKKGGAEELIKIIEESTKRT